MMSLKKNWNYNCHSELKSEEWTGFTPRGKARPRYS